MGFIRLLPRALPYLLLLMGVGAAAACQRPDDCELLDTCPGSLVERAAKLDRDKAVACRECIQEKCATETRKCEGDFACNFSARCRLKASPPEYQACLQDLRVIGVAPGREERFPWEGQDENPFSKCFYANCRSACVGDAFACGDSADEDYRKYHELHIEVSVRDHPDYRPQGDVTLRACYEPSPSLTEGPEVCTAEQTTDAHGRASFPLHRDPRFRQVPIDGLYFRIAEKPGIFPRTIYYPGRLGKTDLQLLALYVVKRELIAAGNRALKRGDDVLRDAGQSLVLSDSCVWEEISVSGLRMFVEDTEAAVPQCRTLEEPCHAGGCTPCVWYAKNKFPDPLAAQTDSTGAGIVGLAPGRYTICVERESGEAVSRRANVRMEAGAMTIVRTWPLDHASRSRCARGPAAPTP